MYQSNVIASFGDYDDANSAASELSRAGFGDVQIRILPPRTTYGRFRKQQIIVSAIVNNAHARAAENILALNGGTIDLHEDANWGGARWDDRHGGFRSERSALDRNRRDDTWLHNIPWGALAGATVALLTGFAFIRSAHIFGQDQRQDYAPGQYRRNSPSFRSAAFSSPHPDGESFRRSLGSQSGGSASQIADEADLAWGDHDADDTERHDNRPSGAGAFQTGAAVRSPSNQGLGSGQNTTSSDGGAMQAGIATGASMTQGPGQASRSGTAATRRANERV